MIEQYLLLRRRAQSSVNSKIDLTRFFRVEAKELNDERVLVYYAYTCIYFRLRYYSNCELIIITSRMHYCRYYTVLISSVIGRRVADMK